MTRLIRYLISIISLIAMLIIYFLLKEILFYLSPDAEVKGTTILYVKQLWWTGFIVLLIICSLFLFNNFAKYLSNSIISLISYCNRKKKIFAAILCFTIFLYIFFSGILSINRYIVNADESTYVSTFRNYITNSQLVYSRAEGTYAIPKDMFAQNIMLILARPLIKNPILAPRYITFIYSFVLLLLMSYFYYKKIGINGVLIFLILCASSPALLYLTSSGFGEHIAILFLISGLYSWHASWGKTNFRFFKFILGVSFTAIAIMTKLQLGIFLLLSFLGIIIYKILTKERYTRELSYVIAFIIIFFAFYSLYLLLLFDREHIIDLIKGLYQRGFTLGSGRIKTVIYYLSSFFRFFNLLNMFLASISVYYLIAKRKSLSFFTILVALLIIFNFFWYMNKNYVFRFMYFSNFGLIILGTLGICHILKEFNRIKYFLYTFLVLNLYFGIYTNIIFSMNGAANEYHAFLNGESSFKFMASMDQLQNQIKFYSEINKIVKPYDRVYFVNAENEMAAFSDLKYYSFPENSDLVKGDYLIIPSVHYLMGSANLWSYLDKRIEIVYELDYYKLFKVIN